MTQWNAESVAAEIDRLASTLSAMLHGQQFPIIAGALAELLSRLLAQLPRREVSKVLAEHVAAVRRLEKENRRIFNRNRASAGADDGSFTKH